MKLDEIIGEIADISEELGKYVPAPGTENCAHLKILKGRRFDENTGEEKSTPYVQIFSFGEYKLFKEHHKLLGYTILEELHNPFN